MPRVRAVRPGVLVARGAGAADALEAGRHRNFDTIRFWAALTVVFSHSFLIGTGGEADEPVYAGTGQIAGLYAVHVFFVMSGFLVTGSRMQSRGTMDYARKRFLRIYPAFAASVLICFLVIGPIFAEGGTAQVFGAGSTWRRLLETLAFHNRQAFLPAFEFYLGFPGTVLNGVYWTITAEVLLYAVIALLCVLRLLSLPGCILVLVVSVYMRLDAPYLDQLVGGPIDANGFSITHGAPGFFAGAVLWFLFRTHEPDGRIAAALAAVTVAGVLISDQMRLLFAVFAAYPIVWLGSQRAPDLGNWARFGDLSYGMYLFGWPVQQVIRSMTGPIDGWSLFAISLGPVLCVAWLSWSLIERPALRLRARPVPGGRVVRDRETPG